MKIKNTNFAKYVIVDINDEAEHEIIFVTDNKEELIRRWLSFVGKGHLYTIFDTKKIAVKRLQ